MKIQISLHIQVFTECILQKLKWFVCLVPVKNCEILFPLYIAFLWQNMFPVLSVINHYLLKAEGHCYYSLNCWERKKNKEIFFLIFFLKIGFDISCKLSPLKTICMKWQILFYGEKNLINLWSAESVHSVVIIFKCLCEKKNVTKLCFS